MPFFELALVFIVGLLAGAFGTLVGAGTMLTVPLMIFLGFPVVETIAANRFGVLGITTSGYYEFNKKKLINHKIALILAIFVTFGAVAGSLVVLKLNEELVEKVIGIVMIGILVFILLDKNIGLKHKKIRFRKNNLLAIIVSLIAGFYLGLIGLVAGMILIYLGIFVFGQTFLESAGTIKLPAFIASLFSFLVFLLNGKVIWSVSIILFVSMFVGSYFGSHYSDKIGNEWIKRLFMIAAGMMALKLLLF